MIGDLLPPLSSELPPTATPLPRESASGPRTLVECLDAWARRQPDATLFTFRDGPGQGTARFDYASFARRTAVIADALHEAGLSRGDRVLLLHPPGLDVVASLFGCARIGAIAAIAPVTSVASLRAARVRDRIHAIVKDCRPVLAVGPSGLSADLLDGLALPMGGLATDDIADRMPMWRYRPHDIALLQYTSGSTSDPRGVAIRHDNIVANARALIDHVPVGATWLPQFHDMGLIGHYLFPVVLGGCNHGMTAASFLRHPALWLRMISERRATFAAAPAFGFEHLLRPGSVRDSELEGVDLSSLRVLMSGAEPVPPDMCRRFAERFGKHGLPAHALVAAYGLAEATLAVTHGSQRICRFDGGQLALGKVVPAASGRIVELCSCGPALSNLQVTIERPDTGVARGEGEVGEICIAGESVAPGYWHERERGWTRSRLRTRDLGFMWEGEIYVCGRVDDLIIRRGEKFHPQDIEAAAERILSLARGSVAFVDRLGRATLLVSLASSEIPMTPEAFADAIAAQTGLRIERLVVAPPRSIALTTSGKLARAATREALESGRIVALRDVVLPSEDRDDDGSVVAWIGRRVRQDPSLEEALIPETGIDSLRLVRLQLELGDLLHRHGFADEAQLLDGPLLQWCRCADLACIAQSLANGDVATAGRRLQALDTLRIRAADDEQRQMASDACLPLPAKTVTARAPGVSPSLLLTGATGFLGPHLVANLLAQSDLPMVVLVRARDDDEAQERVESALRAVAPGILDRHPGRLRAWCGDLARPGLGLSPRRRDAIRQECQAIYHNAALVDYVRNYAALRVPNVLGTHGILELAMGGAPKRFHHISSTFIFGWTRKGILFEDDANEAMAGLDFGYSQSKWVAERLVRRAAELGLEAAVYRPSLISIARSLHGDPHDVAARLLAFMIRHRLAVDTPNQVSLLPVDTLAHNLVAISLRPDSAGTTYHLTADRYYSLTELTRQIGRDFGFEFREHGIADFIARLNRLARPEDPVFPLLDFFTRSAPHIAAMALKRYDNRRYRQARDATPGALPDSTLAETAARLVRFIADQGWIAPDLARVSR